MPGQEDLEALRRDIRRLQDREPNPRFGTYPDFDLDADHRTLGDEEIQNRFGFHKGTIEGPNATAPRHAYLRVLFMEFADMLDRILPNGRAKSVALTELETTSMWAHQAVAQLAPVTHE